LRITLIVSLFIIVLGGFIGAVYYQKGSISSLYQDGGFKFKLISDESSQTVATIVSADTTAPVKSQVRAIHRTGYLWVDALAWVKNDRKTYPVTKVTGLTSNAGPIDLSQLATDTAVALKGQRIRYGTASYSFEATQTGTTLVVQTATFTGAAAALPARLFTDGSGHALTVALSPVLEAKLLAEVVRIAGEQAQKSSDYEAMTLQVTKAVRPYSSVLSASAAQAIQTKLEYLKGEEVKLAEYEGTLLNVPLISQLPAFPAGCEAASTAMLITYGGHPVTTADIVNVMPYASDPSNGYVGNPRTFEGWTIFPSAMKSVVKKYLGTGTNQTGIDLEDLYELLREGKPVVCWLGGRALPGVGIHCVCVTGYGKGMVYYNDPYLNIKNKAVSASTFTSWWGVFGNKAMSY